MEILKSEPGWSGHLRIGLTQHNPDTGFEVPQYSLPDLVTLLGKSSRKEFSMIHSIEYIIIVLH